MTSISKWGKTSKHSPKVHISTGYAAIFKHQNEFKDDIAKKDGQIAALANQLNDLTHGSEIKQMKIQQLQTELRLYSVQKEKEPFKMLSEQIPKAENRDTSIKQKKESMPKTQTNDSKWFKIVGKNEKLLKNENDHTAALDNEISLLDNSVKPMPIVENARTANDIPKGDTKEEYIVQLFTQTIVESQSDNGFFDVRSKVKAESIEPAKKKESRGKQKDLMCNGCKKVNHFNRYMNHPEHI